MSAPAAAMTLLWCDHALGLNFKKALEQKEEAPKEVRALLAEREEKRKAGNFAAADEIRKKISAFGWHIRDTDTGPKLSQKEN